ncbi:MAG: hypothetical protein EHM87_15815 [Burkholderiales bacterium]|nr:MAG: hypothetical protein EHM87_15815 [Burkholderiales bacterium]
MPALALSGTADAAFGADGVPSHAVPIHLSALAAASIEVMLGGRHGHVGAAQLPALRAMPADRRADGDLAELVRAAGRAGGVFVTFL